MVDRIPFNFDDLHPEARTQFRDLTAKLRAAWMAGQTEFLLYPFEGFRSAARQNWLLTQGTTKAKAYTGAHWYGLAVDYVADLSAKRGVPLKEVGKPYWPDASHPDWRVLGETAASVGLVQPIRWDKPHVEHPSWALARRAL